jgi:hypothetical protein
MEPFKFELFEPLLSELNDRLKAFQEMTNDHLQAVKQLSSEMDQELSTMQPDPVRWAWMVPASNQIRQYIEQCLWFEKEGYPPRIKKEDFDFEAECRHSKEKGSIPNRIQYLELVLLEYRTFAGKVQSKFNHGFGERIHAEIKRLKMELVLSKKPDSDKLVWLRKPSEFGYIFFQLIENGFIQDPSGFKMSPKGIAEVLLEHFDFEQGTTIQTLTKALTNDPANLGDKTFEKLKFPHSAQLGTIPKKKLKNP